MATTAGDIYVRSGASGSFTSVEYVQGGWITVASSSNMSSIYHDRLKDGQIIWVESESQLYVTRKFVAFETEGYAGFEDSASFSTTSLGISSATPTLQQVTDQGNTTDVSMSIMGIDILSNTNSAGYSASIYIGENVVENSTLTPSTAREQTFIGADAGRNLGLPSYGLTAIGHGAMKGKEGNSQGGSANTAIGAFSLFDIDDNTISNTAVGYSSLLNMESGSGNVAIGARVAFNSTQLQDSVIIGSNARPLGISNQIVIGTNAFGSGSNTVTIGNGKITDNYFTGNLTGSIDDVYIAGWGSVSASLASVNGGGGSTPSGTISGSAQITEFGLFVLNSVTSSMSVATASFISDTFISASAARSGFGSGGVGGGSSIFSLTGSIQSTTNDLQITGSVTIGDGVLKLKEYTTTPTAEAGAIFYSASAFYFGVD